MKVQRKTWNLKKNIKANVAKNMVVKKNER
jgi:hypothetical protein